MKKILASILALTMIFSLVGGISSFAEEMKDSFAGGKGNSVVGFLETAKEALKGAKEFISPICFDKFLKKLDFFSSVVSRPDFYYIDKKDWENIKSDICNIECEFWDACKDDINKLPVALQKYFKGINRRTNEGFMCPVEKTSFLEKVMNFFGLANRNEL